MYGGSFSSGGLVFILYLAAFFAALIPPVVAFIRHIKLRVVVLIVSVLGVLLLPHILLKILCWLVMMILAFVARPQPRIRKDHRADDIVSDDYMK